MKKLLILTAIFCVYFQSVTVSAATPDYSGEWELNAGKSTLPKTAGIEAMTLKVSQTAKEITIATSTRASVELSGTTKQSDVAKTIVYNLDGTEKTTEIGSGIMAVTETKKAKVMADGKLSLTITRKPGTKTNETWELLDKGNTLKIVRYTETVRGGMNFQLYFTKKIREGIATRIVSSDEEMTAKTPSSQEGIATRVASRDANRIAKKGEPFDVAEFKEGGILNFRAYSLTRPEYPESARAVRAGGVVLVKATVDENGDVVSATATSGHPLLQQAAEKAAQKAKFNPPTDQGKPAKVTGILIYNFVP